MTSILRHVAEAIPPARQGTIPCLAGGIKWQMKLAIDKCNWADLGVPEAVDSRTLSPNVGRCALLKACNVKDMGIVFYSKLTFTPYISKIVTKAKQKLFMLFRCFGTKVIDSLIKGYKSYVLPVLEYGSPFLAKIH